jgi:hypothetical protein
MFLASERAGSTISDKVTTKPRRTIHENLLLLIISPPFVLRLLNDDRPVWMLRAEKNSDENDAEDSLLSASDYREKRCNCQQIKEKEALSSNLIPFTFNLLIFPTHRIWGSP